MRHVLFEFSWKMNLFKKKVPPEISSDFALFHQLHVPLFCTMPCGTHLCSFPLPCSVCTGSQRGVSGPWILLLLHSLCWVRKESRLLSGPSGNLLRLQYPEQSHPSMTHILLPKRTLHTENA